MLPALVGDIILPAAPKEFLFKGFFLGPVPVRLPPLKTPLDLQKIVVKPNVFFNILTFRTLLGRVCIKIAFLSKCIPRSSRKHILANHVQQKSNFSDWMCLRMPSCRIWAAKQISKIPCKYVYYLHMGRSWGSLKFFDASSFLMFVLFYFGVLVSARNAWLLWGFLASLAGN